MTSRSSTEQLLVQVFLRAIDHLLAVMDEHGLESEERKRAEAEVELAFPPLWHRVPRLALRCMSDGMWWNEARVLGPDEGRSPFLATLVSSGIQGLELEPGVEKHEIRRFIELVDEKSHRDPHGDKDLVMMLFQADLRHLRYSVREGDDDVGAPSGSRPSTRPAPESVREAVRADAAATESRGVVELERFDSTLYFLDQREMEYLRTQVERQYAVDHTRSALALLLDTLQLHEDPESREEVISTIRTFLPYILAAGNFTSLTYLTSELRTVLRETDLHDDHRTALSELLESVSERSTLTQIFLMLEDGRVPTAKALTLLLRELDLRALETVLVWSGQLRRPEAKSALLTALEGLFADRPTTLLRILASRDRAVVQRALMMAGKLRTPELVDGVAATLQQEDPTARKLAVEVLANIGGAAAMRHLTKVLADPDSGVRSGAYRAFLNRPYRSAAQGFQKVMDVTDVEGLGLSERKLLFSAFGAVVGAEGTAELERILAGKRARGRRPSSETRACAALALEQIDTRAARDALKAATRYGDPLVRSAAAAALRDLR